MAALSSLLVLFLAAFAAFLFLWATRQAIHASSEPERSVASLSTGWKVAAALMALPVVVATACLVSDAILARGRWPRAVHLACAWQPVLVIGVGVISMLFLSACVIIVVTTLVWLAIGLLLMMLLLRAMAGPTAGR